MSPTYAAGTEVSSARSREEIEATLRRYGAARFAYMSEEDRAMVAFEKEGRQVRFIIPLPDREHPDFTHHSRGRREPSAIEKLYEQAVRQRWRALALVVKAKLEAVEAGIAEFDQEFGMYVVPPGGQTVHERLMPEINRAVADGKMPRLEIGSGS